MKKILLYLKGYRKIDRLVGLWRHSYKDFNLKDVVFADYAKYDVYYNEKSDFYKVLLSGFRPLEHFLNGEIVIMLGFLNIKPENEYIKFSKSVQDYFIQKESLLNTIGSEEEENNEGSDFIVMRFSLEQDKSIVTALQSDDLQMVRIIQNFKKYLSNNIEVYEEFDNVLVTSEGYYISAHRSALQQLKKDSNDENEEID